MEARVEPTHLYHYTTAEGLKGIVENQEIWATDIFYLNDWMEFHRGRKELKRLIDERLASMQADTYEKRIAQIVSALLEPPNSLKDKHVFVCSFSAAEEGDDLSQWRAYAQDGGYSIGFRRDRLDELTLSRNGFRMERCRYFEDCADHLDRLLQFLSEVEKRENIETSIRATDLVLSSFAAVYKDSSFAAESEWRLICTLSELTLKFRICRSVLIPYATFALGDQRLWEDVHIVVGPCSREEDELRRRSVKMLIESELPKHGLPTTCAGNVRLSKIPYRTAMG